MHVSLFDVLFCVFLVSGHSSARSRPALTQGIPSDYTPSTAFTNEPSTPSNDSQQYKGLRVEQRPMVINVIM